jgi:polyisoprenoid-binding protein YceI
MAKWLIDTTHSEVQFKVKHLVISTVTGSFNKFSAELEAEKEDFTDAKVSFSADIDSIDTNNEQRDGHLKSDDFFSAAQFPQLSFASTSFEKESGSDYILKGDLTMRGVTKGVELAVDFGGVAKDPYGQTKAGFEAVGKISRKEFGLAWSAVTEAGGIVVSDEIKLLLNVQFIKQA